MVTKSPNPVDRHVGTRVRMRRMMIGMSQEKLGEALGITFQQVQKYEKGMNRISASRLQQTSRVLGVPIDYFYEGAPQFDAEAAGGFAENPSPAYMAELTTNDGLNLLKAFASIKSARVRRRVVELVRALAEDDEA
jgi:transcriptional regulator with XRE-family HTH domain